MIRTLDSNLFLPICFGINIAGSIIGMLLGETFTAGFNLVSAMFILLAGAMEE